MPRTAARPEVFGPFDGDFDPFDEEEDVGVVITFGRVPVASQAAV